MSPEIIIIGAGISGLSAALKLQQRGLKVRVLEARERIGGRALSHIAGNGGAVDLGPAWIWPAYQPRVSALIKELELDTLPQYESGALCYETTTDLQHIQYPTRYHDTARLRLGVQGLAQALAARLESGTLSLSSEVTKIEIGEHCQVTARNSDSEEELLSDKIIVAVPGPLVKQWQFTPGLAPELNRALDRWPTWMAAHAKFVALYPEPFWRNAGLSGSAISQRGPLMEIADQSDTDAGYAALFGFFGWPAAQRHAEKDTLQTQALAQLVRLFGAQAGLPVATHLQDWSTEAFTAAERDLEMPGSHPPYGEAQLQAAWCSGRLLFAGAEASAESGGLIEGAIAAGEHAATLAMAKN